MLALGLLWGHIRNSAEDHPFFSERRSLRVHRFSIGVGFRRPTQLRKPEIKDFDQPLRRHHHVRGFQVAMHDSGRVSDSQRVGNLRGIFQRIANPQSFAADQVMERLTGHQLHRDVLDGLALQLLCVDVVDGDDVRVVQR